ncbi:TIGR01777 family oxidoreductase [Desulfosarcina ovata]|uniref:Epimerase n=1 Tax=Desulfosarcina ovata subsp. ovata TaxID=2752305 RepID=A0A5K8AF72_9BACT|nr:TIGR01777 family oxidoreductase [Desulfosarcina ovata]BBO91199.1 epimerase [Desulfosarcina ovata subsp. ovata]
MHVFIAGASGFVGTALSRFLLDAGTTVTGVGRSRTHPFESVPAFTWLSADTTQAGPWQTAVAEADAVVNLTGCTIFKRWTRGYKARMVDSRIRTTGNIVEAMKGGHQRLLSTSAVGYYGSRGDEDLTEDSAPGDDFLARLAVDWEQTARQAGEKGVRVSIMRFGVVLGAGGGALARMLPAFRRFAGGPLGSGRQWFAWIHLADVLAGIQYLLDGETAAGIYNFCAPQTVRQKDFASRLGDALGRPAWLPAPSPALKLVLGEVAQVLLASQKVHPRQLLAEHFPFRFGDLDRALADLVRRP